MVYKESARGLILPPTVKNALPETLRDELDMLPHRMLDTLEEIRLRCDRKTEFVMTSGSILVDFKPSQSDMDSCFYELCERSIYTHAETICLGYIRAPCSVRIGVCGRASVENGRITAVRDISSLVIRLPHRALPSVTAVAENFINSGGGMLVFSPPRGGKTTVLRALAVCLADRYSKRVAVIDTRGELGFALVGDRLRIDVLDGYPRSEGIEIAVRGLAPDVIICDEIGSESDAAAIMQSANSGVPIIASVHAGDLSELSLKSDIFTLVERGIFKKLVALERRKDGLHFDIHDREEVIRI